jgi:hypothetical protein
VLGETIGRLDPGRPRIVASDFRVAFYAGGRFDGLEPPVDADRLGALVAQPGWLVTIDDELEPEARAILAPLGAPVAEHPVSRGKRTARLYRLDRPSDGRH